MTAPISLRERQKLQTREHLLHTAGTLFGENGFAATSIDDIINAAGISRATLYAYFDGKDALLFAIVERMYVEARDRYDGFASLPDWSHESVLGWIRAFADVRIRESRRYQAVITAAPGLFMSSDEVHTWFGGLVASVRQNAELWSQFTDDEADMRATMIVSMIEEQFAARIVCDSALDLDTFLVYLVNAVCQLLRTP